MVTIGVHIQGDPDRLRRTLTSLARHGADARVVLLYEPGEEPLELTSDAFPRLVMAHSGRAAAFNRLATFDDAPIVVLLESGVVATSGWIERLCAALEPAGTGLAGPSTNSSWNEQRLPAAPGPAAAPEEIERFADTVAARYRGETATLQPLYSLADFCFAVKRELVAAIGGADVDYGTGPCWEMDYNIRAARAGFQGVWVKGAYVHRSPPTTRHIQETRAGFAASKQRYQDKFCGLRLRGEKRTYETHCRGEACPHFAPAGRIRLRQPLAAPRLATVEAAGNGPQPGLPPSPPPLVSCIMPTHNRRSFLPRALQCFQQQDYPRLELVVVDDGTDPIRDCLPDDPRIRYVRLEHKQVVGEKRNVACEQARGEIIVHWDDDDWYPSWRVSVQVRALEDHGVEVCGSSQVLYHDPAGQCAWCYRYVGPGCSWVAGNTLAFRRSFWERNPFAPLQIGEDQRFLEGNGIPPALFDLVEPALCVATIHPGNTSRKVPSDPYWHPEPVSRIRELLAGASSSESPGSGAGSSPGTSARPLVSCIMPTFNRRAFIPFAVALFQQQDYPNRELLVVDDGDDAVGNLVDGHDRVRYIRLDRRKPIGAKRNVACAQARGEIIAHWDDDDWYAPDRLSYQVGPILTGAADITGLEGSYLLDVRTAQFWSPRPALHRRMFVGDVHGGTLVYRRAILQPGVHYPETSLAEDAMLLLEATKRGRRLTRLANRGVYVYVRHGQNAWEFEPGRFLDPAGWERVAAPSQFPDDALRTYRAAAVAQRGLGEELHVASTPSAEIVPVGTVGTAPPAHESATYLDALTLQRARVGYGTLGLHGELGYEGQGVSVQGQLFAHAFSTHPPARVTVELDGRYTRFRCRVALNDDVSRHGAHADFSVLADGRLVAQVPHVLAGTGAHDLTANVRDAHRLELVVHTSHWEYCHAVWLDPVVDAEPLTAETTLVDCLGRAEIMLPIGLPRTAHCVATVVTPGFAALLDNVLGSLNANGCCQDALLVVFAVNADDACARVAAKYGATLIPCQANTRVNATVKSILYSVARVVDADRYLCIDADMLVLDNLRPIFSALEACRAGSILACREGNGHDLANLEQALRLVYGGRPGDIVRLVGNAGAEGAYPLVVNDGLFAGDRSALLALDDTIRQWSHATRWVDERRDIWWRNQFVFNLALARLQSGVELDPTYNVQLHVQDVDLSDAAGGPRAMWRGTSVRVLHFSGVGRRKYPQLRDRFARIGTPLAGEGAGDSYGQFVAALRGWIARHGLPALAWSFYGTSDATSARVSDPSVFPLLAVLHYLIRANGCVRVLETGTARGVSTACLASAVAHRDSARVVTFDVQVYPARDDLWAALPEPMRACIEARTIDSLAGMAAAAEVGERYEAALLDTVHTAEHVMAEFQLAKELVCPGGLILVHDAQYTNGTVADALQRIEAEGYGVVRLWHAEAGANEDDGLGLAVIENRRRPTVAGAGAHSDVASVRLSSLYDRDDDV